jgi:hypothetical protein
MLFGQCVFQAVHNRLSLVARDWVNPVANGISSTGEN